MNPEVDDLIPTRQSLLGRLKQWDDQESWRDFFNTYWKLIYRAATRCGLSDTEAQEVVQETIIDVARKVERFTYDPGRDSFKGWLLYLTRKRVAGQFRKRERDRRLSVADVDQIPDPSLSGLDSLWDNEWQKNLIDAALAVVKQQVDPKQFQIFDFYALKEWPVAEVIKTLAVSSAQVYLAKHRVGRLLTKELRRIEKEMQ